MIEVNLLPGGRAQRRGAGSGFGITFAVVLEVFRKTVTAQ